MKNIFLILILSLLINFGAFGEIFNSPTWGFSLDLPEGFELTDKKGDTRYLFSNKVIPVELIILLYPRDKAKTANAILSDVHGKLKASLQSNLFSIKWREKNVSISQISFLLPGNRTLSKGWSISVELYNEKGTLVVVAYTEEKNALEMEDFIISCLDSICIDEASAFEAGPMTSAVFKKEKDINYNIKIADREITFPLDIKDADANQSVIDREYRVLSAYIKTELLTFAWQRYYRIIYRDAYKRIERASQNIFNTLLSSSPEKENRQRIMGVSDLVAALLNWTQHFEYIRDTAGSDFISIPKVIAEGTGDCDSRAVLLAIMLNKINCRTVLFVSPYFNHAVAGFSIEGKGARMEIDKYGNVTGTGKNGYLVGETVAKVSVGLIAEDISDYRKWFAVIFP